MLFDVLRFAFGRRRLSFFGCLMLSCLFSPLLGRICGGISEGLTPAGQARVCQCIIKWWFLDVMDPNGLSSGYLNHIIAAWSEVDRSA